MRPGLFVFLLLITSNVMAAKTPLIVGVWKGNGNLFVVRPDGTAHHSAGRMEGTWKAANKTGRDFIIHWSNGVVDQIKINRGDKSFDGFTPSSNYRFQKVRDSYPPIEREVKKKPVKKQPARQKKTKVRIPRDAVKYKGHYYMVFDIQGPQSEATKKAESLGGHLVRITNPGQHQFVAQLASGGQLRDYWIDGSDIKKEGSWLFGNGTTMRFFNMPPGEPDDEFGREHHLMIRRDGGWKWHDFPGSDREPGFICEWDTTNRGAKVKDAVEERVEPEIEELEEEPEPFSLGDEPEQQPLKPFSLDDDPVEEEADEPPPTDPEGILDRAGLYEGRRGVWYLKRANNFAARTYERLSKSSEIRSALRAVNGRLPNKAEINNPPSRR